jgi:hypothetical protein
VCVEHYHCIACVDAEVKINTDHEPTDPTDMSGGEQTDEENDKGDGRNDESGDEDDKSTTPTSKRGTGAAEKKTAVPVKPSGTRKGKGKSTASGVDSGNAPDVAGDESPPQSPSKAKTATPNTTVTNPFFGPRSAALAASKAKAEGGALKRKQSQATEEPIETAATPEAPPLAKKKGKK